LFAPTLLTRVLSLVTAAAITFVPLAGASAAPSRVAAAIDFVTPDYAPASGFLPQQTAAGDFTGDGVLDAVSVNQGPSSVFGKGIGVSVGNGKGGLSKTVQTDLGDGEGACDLAVGDWNGDAMSDLVVLECTTGGEGNIVAMVSTGGGHFEKTQSWAGAKVQLVAADVNLDGKTDFVTSARGSAQVRTYLGNGNGKFQAPLSMAPSFDSYDLELADLNGDGLPDLVGASGGPVWSMLGKGDGTFKDQVFRGSSVLTGIELAVADLNGDDHLDVAVVDASGGHLGVGLGTGTGAFTDGQQVALGTRQAIWVAAGRVTSDGNADIVAGLDNDSTATALLRGHGDGTLSAPTTWVTGAAGLTVADFTQDGRQDLLTLVPSGRVYLNVAAGGGFRSPQVTSGPNAEDVADLNGDGHVDKISGVTACCTGGITSQLIVQLGDGSGHFGKQIVTHVRAEQAGAGLDDIAVADINEDGIPDVVGGFENFQPQPSNVFWAIGKGNGTFKKPTLSSSGDANADVPAVTAADVNGDGHVDLVANDLAHLVVRLGNGTAGFDAPIASGVANGADRAVLVSDVTGDGVADIVTMVRTGNEDFGSGEIRLERGAGDGTFALVQTLGTDSNLSGGAMADLNGDHRLDFVTAGSRGFDGGVNALWVTLRQADGRLGAPLKYLGPTGQVACGDVDLDGDLDIATTGNATVDLYLNDGAGGFPKRVDILAGGSLGTVADLTEDQSPDVISGTPFGFAVHLNSAR
jgi:hypothetical protein